MFLSIFGIIDLFLVLIILASNILPKGVVIIAAAYIILKGIFFVLHNDTVSYVDIVVGIYLVLLVFGFSLDVVTFMSAVFLAQKGLLSIV